jgi:hypothetical protein
VQVIDRDKEANDDMVPIIEFYGPSVVYQGGDGSATGDRTTHSTHLPSTP